MNFYQTFKINRTVINCLQTVVNSRDMK